MAVRRKPKQSAPAKNPPCEPAASIIKKLGGARIVSDITHTARTAPYRWQAPRHEGGANGLIPPRHHPALLRHARRAKVPLDPVDFLSLAIQRAAGRI